MTHEYGDPLSEEAIAATVACALRRRDEQPEQSLELHIEHAVHECICACAIEIEDNVEQARSGLHMALFAEIKRLVEEKIDQSKAAHDNAEVDEASDESFPASDPPGWIWERHSRDGGRR